MSGAWLQGRWLTRRVGEGAWFVAEGAWLRRGGRGQESREVGDWRKNVDALSGMEGRKKKFEAPGGGQG